MTIKKIDFKSLILPHILAIITFLIVTIGYFSPIFFKNQNIEQQDILQWQGSAKELIDYREQTGEEGLWTNSMFSGMPAYLISVDWSDDIIETFHRIYTFGLPHPVRMVFAALLSFYILCLSFGIRPYVAIIGAFIFGFSSFIIIGIAAGHNARIGAIAYMPLVVAGIHLVFTGKKWLGVGITASALALHLRVNHLQITYYLLIATVIYGIIMLISYIRQGTLKEYILNLSILLVAALIAVSSFFGPFWATYEYSKYSIRGESELTPEDEDSGEEGLDKSYAFEYSNSIFEPLVLFIPNIYGGSSSNYLISDPESNTFRALQRSGDQQTANQLARFSSGYWGKQSPTAPYYAGAVTLLILILGILFVKRKYKVWLLSLFVLAVVLSWGDNFASLNYFLFDHLPGYNKFRSVTFAIVMAIFSISLLGCLGLKKLLEKGLNKDTRKKLFIAFGISAGFCLFLFLFAGLFDLSAPVDSQLPTWFTTALEQDRAVLLREDAFRSFLYILVAFAVIWFVLQKKLNTIIGAILLVLVVIIDLWSVDKRYLNEEHFKRSPDRSFFAETEADKLIKQDQALSYRVYNLAAPFNDARTSYHHKSVGGYHGAKIRRYQDLYDHVLQPQTMQLINKIRSGDEDFSGLGVINMLNIRYFYAGSSRNAVLKNDYAYGNAWFVDRVLEVDNPDEEIEALSDTDLKTTAIVDRSKFRVSSDATDTTGTIELTSYAPNKLTYVSESSTDNLAVFSEIYYPKGWKAFIDGDPAEIKRVNFVLRALEIPAGKHNIEFRFEPNAYYTGNKITLFGNVLTLLFLLGTLGIEIRKNFVSSK